MADSPYDLSTGRKGFKAFEPEVIARKPGESHPLDRYREGVAQGRAEILALVAEIDPLHSVNGVSPADTCFFCGCDGRHAEDCLWVRAQQAASEER